MQPENQGGELERLQQFLERLEAELGTAKYQNWFAQKTRVSLAADELSIVCGSSYLAGWLQKQYRTVVRRVVDEQLGAHTRVMWTHDEQVVLVPPTVSSTAPAQRSVARTSHDVEVQTKTHGGRRGRELSTFVQGPSNLLAWSGVQQILRGHGHSLYLYSGVGNGKSHLLDAVAAQVRRDDPRKQVLSLSAEGFSNYFTQALDSRTIASFRQRFRSVDVLVMDDIDFLDGKKGIQEEFLNTLRKLESRNGQLIVAGDRHPNLLTRTSPEILTRFTSGLVCRIETPDLTTRRLIVESLRTMLEVDMSEDVVDFVAARFKDNVRELEGAMNTLQNWALAAQRRVTPSVAREQLVRLERDCIRIVRMTDVEQAVCQTFGLTAEDLRSDKRTRTATQPRMLAMYLARRLTGTAYAEIGEFFGGRNHSTVVSAERRIQDLVSTHSRVRIGAHEWTVEELVETLERQILVG
jgi:chromosomal replication initiator protein